MSSVLRTGQYNRSVIILSAGNGKRYLLEWNAGSTSLLSDKQEAPSASCVYDIMSSVLQSNSILRANFNAFYSSLCVGASVYTCTCVIVWMCGMCVCVSVYACVCVPVYVCAHMCLYMSVCVCLVSPLFNWPSLSVKWVQAMVRWSKC